MRMTTQINQSPFYYGWVIVFISALGIFFSGPGQTFSNAVFIDYYIQDFGWSRSYISGLYSTATLLAGLCMLWMGQYVDRYGQRKMSVFISLLLSFACLWNSIVTGPVMLFIGFFFIRLLGQGGMMLVHTTLVPQWFIKQRGRAFSFMLVGGALGATCMPPLNTWMIESWGWEVTWRMWALLIGFLFVPLAYLFIRNRPEDVGLTPDPPSRMMNTAINHGNDPEQTRPNSYVEPIWTLNEAIRTRTFWLILFCVAIPSMVNTGLTFHFISILGKAGITLTSSALILGMIPLISFPTKFLAGFLVERIKVHYILAISFLGQIIAMLVLMQTTSVAMAIAFGIARGLVEGFESICLNIVWPNYFGRKHLGSIRGVVMTTTVIASAFGPLPFGVAYDWFGGYKEIMIVMMFFTFMASIASLLSPVPRKNIMVGTRGSNHN